MRLVQLLVDAGLPTAGVDHSVAVGNVVQDSREAGPGAVFVAVPGYHADGLDFAAAAVERGAIAVVAQRPPAAPLPVPVLIVPDARAALAPLSAAINGHPSRALVVAGVTGTDGKTTTATMLWAAWQAAGIPAGALTTVDFRTRESVTANRTRQTTLEAPDLQRRLRKMAAAGCSHVAMEVSSHSLELHRVDSVTFAAAVYTRITSEHLDFHDSREGYFRAKAGLLARAAGHPGGLAVLDRDDSFAYPRLAAMDIARRVSYSAAGAPDADLIATGVTAGAEGVRFRVRSPWGEAQVALRLAGRFNAANCLAALGAACATGASFEAAIAGLNALDRVHGRMERVDLGQGFTVVIDYAHTAAALRSVLDELRAAIAGRLWVVFGSAGERDVEKRPEMGRVAAERCERVVITDEDPREENRQAILDAIAAGTTGHRCRPGSEVVVVPDRDRAIRYAIDHAAPGDCVLLAGKGHESSIIRGRSELPWDERAEAEAAVRARLERERESGDEGQADRGRSVSGA